MEHLALAITLAGLIIGLGAATVIDWCGFLGIRSPYWTETAIRTHKVTKPLIWVGIGLVIVGHWLQWQGGLLPAAAVPLRVGLITMLLLNGSFLSFVISPQLLARERAGQAATLLSRALQAKIALSLVVSMTGWWTLVWVVSGGL